MDKRLNEIMRVIDKGEEFRIFDFVGTYKYMLEVMELCSNYNALGISSEYQKRMELIKGLFQKTGKNFIIPSPFYCMFGLIEIGENFICNRSLTIQDLGRVKMGDNVMIGPNVTLNTSGHSLNSKRRAEGWSYAYPIIIEDNVFIGSNVVINANKKNGVTIGKNSVIGSGSVVTKSMPENVLAHGNPCRVIRTLE